ncbi:selenocysteine-specific translation elongation factor SelB [Nakamurella panacisegetis]|uniref:Selenocysteine-specific translation elongation factor SelB n=1 Tax=Nakamurella panacisegetis TaxID=1090615 RepID=A0A1H0RHN6_9ACTN|nr:selenocysteine-specific translation elongation factor [Nakamurella panacisegetis]SDP28961.1 selenocysteine-specific translation elongation factor SelB [Nakamurella panacisegetis]
MHVIATAGHVDHGKSTLVRALTGMEPDRWAEEKARGMTIDLGFAWTTLPQGPTVAFVDVPGHERFIGNMLAGVGAAPAVMMVVGADEGWRAQSAEHLQAVDALGVQHGLLVVTRADLADPGPATVSALAKMAGSSLSAVEAVAVSGRTGAGLDELRDALARMALRLPTPRTDGRVRLWVDRSFSIRGSGTVVTGTLSAGSLAVGDTLHLNGHPVRIRGLQSLGRPQERVDALARVAINLRNVGAREIHRGSALLTPDAWIPTSVVDVRTNVDTPDLPTSLVLHIGSGAFTVRLRQLGQRTARLTTSIPLPLEPGDRGILRDPGQGRIVCGVEVADVAPPEFRRRGAAAARGALLDAIKGPPSLAGEVRRRGAVLARDLERAGIDTTDWKGVRVEGAWLVDPTGWERWADQLVRAVRANDDKYPLHPGLPLEAARRAANLPDGSWLPQLAVDAGLEIRDGRVTRPGSVPSLGPAEAAMRCVEERLRCNPFDVPDRPELQRLKLGRAQLAAAEAAGRIVRLTDDIVLLPQTLTTVMIELARLPQPFSTSAARASMGTTRRVAVPLLEYLDRVGRTKSLSPGSRIVVVRE